MCAVYKQQGAYVDQCWMTNKYEETYVFKFMYLDIVCRYIQLECVCIFLTINVVFYDFMLLSLIIDKT